MTYKFTKNEKGNLVARLLLFVFAFLGLATGAKAQAPEVKEFFSGVKGTTTSLPIVNQLAEGKTLFWTSTDYINVVYSTPVDQTTWKLIQNGNVVAQGNDDASGMSTTTHLINCKNDLLAKLQDGTVALGDVTVQLDATVDGNTHEAVTKFTCNLTDAPHMGIFRYYNSETTPIKGNSSTYLYFATGSRVTKAVCSVYQNDAYIGDLEYVGTTTGGNSVTCKKDVLGPFLENLEAGLLIFKVKSVTYKSPIDGTTEKTYTPIEGDYEDGRILYAGANAYVKSESHTIDGNTILSWYPTDGTKGVLKFTFSDAANTEGVNAYLEYGAGDMIPQTPVDVTFENYNKTLVVDLRGLPLNPTALAQGQTFADEQGNPITPKTINLQVKNLKTTSGSDIGMNVTYVAGYDENGNPTGETKTYFVKGIFKTFDYQDITFDDPVLEKAEFYAAADPSSKTEGITDASEMMDLTIENYSVIASADVAFMVEDATIATVADANITKNGGVWTVQLPAEVKAAGSSNLSITLVNVTYTQEDGAEHSIKPLSLVGIASTVAVKTIAEIKELPNGAQIVMSKNADGAYVTMAQNGYVFIEDASAAIQVVDEQKPLAAGKVLYGTISGTYTNGMLELSASSSFTMSDGTIEPTEMTVEEAKKAENLNRLVKFVADNSNISYLGEEGTDDDYYIIDNEIATINDFLPEDYQRPENVASIAGILYNPGQSLMLLVRSTEDIEAVADPTVYVNSIAELVALEASEEGLPVNVKISNGKVTYAQNDLGFMTEDSSSTMFNFDNEGASTDVTVKGFERGKAFTGTVTGKWIATGFGPSLMISAAEGNFAEVDVTNGETIASAAEITDKVNALVTVTSDQLIEQDGVLMVGKCMVADAFETCGESLDNPEKIESVTGIVLSLIEPEVGGMARAAGTDEGKMFILAPRDADDIKEKADEKVEVITLAGLKDVEVTGIVDVVVEVTNAKVTYVNEDYSVAFIEDATAAIETYIEDFVPTWGTAFNGKLNIQLAETGMVTLVSADDCTVETADVSKGKAVANLEELGNLVNFLVTVENTDATPIVNDPEGFGAMVGETCGVFDYFDALALDYEFPENIKSVTGIVKEVPELMNVDDDENLDENDNEAVIKFMIAPRNADDIEAGETNGIKSVETADNANAAVFNIAGQKVNENYKGIVIKNGKKSLKK